MYSFDFLLDVLVIEVAVIGGEIRGEIGSIVQIDVDVFLVYIAILTEIQSLILHKIPNGRNFLPT